LYYGALVTKLQRRIPWIHSRFAAALVAMAGFGVEYSAQAQDAGQAETPMASPEAQEVVNSEPAAPPIEKRGLTEMPEVVVRGRAEDILGVAVGASEGAIGEEDLKDLPLLRRGEIMETVPGLVVTQHSGDGKANQYFLRGFNLDHGTDFAFSVDNVPVNLPSHAHGQGYSDLNFMIPELVSFIEYRKGPFYSEVGDFSGSGAANVHLVSSLPQGTINLQGGMYGFVRGLAAASSTVGPGTLLYALEYNHYNGPWVVPEGSNRYNGLLRYHWSNSQDQYSLTASVYAAPNWHSTDQVAERAIDGGLITRFGALDPSDGGNTGRGALTFNWTRKHDDGQTTLTMYGFYYRLNLYSNFTYYLNDHTNGDQFEQIDRRYVAGADLKRTWDETWFGKSVQNVLGVQIRNDYLPLSGLDNTDNRQVVNVVVDDRVEELTTGVYGNNQILWNDWFRTNVGVRADVFSIDVTSDTPANSGSKTAAIVNPKASFIFGPWQKTELYLNLGTGFHSNDARGVTLTVNPDSTLIPAGNRVPLLVRTKGTEVGTRTSILPGLVSTVSLWFLQSDSELTFDGDAGDTEPNTKSNKYGVEWANFYKPISWLTLVADIALTHARYVDEHDGKYVGPYIANSIPIVVSGVATVEAPIGIFTSARVRYFSSQPLIEDNSAREPDSLIIDAKLGYRHSRYEVAADILNLLNSKSDDIAYYYPSCLKSELPGGSNPIPSCSTPGGPGVNGVHIHPVEPFEVRAGLTVHY
jgi:hypothetical protein